MTEIELYRQEGEERRYITLRVDDADGSVNLSAQDLGPFVEKTWGDADYEFWVSVPAAAIPKLALLWQIFSGVGFPNQFFCDSWVVGFWRGRPSWAGPRIGRKSLD